jgi:hypothetical protein
MRNDDSARENPAREEGEPMHMTNSFGEDRWREAAVLKEQDAAKGELAGSHTSRSFVDPLTCASR